MGFFTPDKYVTDVSAIDLDELWDKGKRALFLDRDNTVVPRDTKVVPPSAVAWLDYAHELGYRVCFVSNNWAKNVRPDAQRFGAQMVTRAAKPLPFGLWHALHKVGVGRKQAVLVGDQVFTDVLGGKLSGIYTVLVQPQTEVDLAHTLLLRRLEERVLDGLTPEGASRRCSGSGKG